MSAASTKRAGITGGHAVTTVAFSSTATAAEPHIQISVAAGKKAGFLWGDGGAVTKITKGGLCEKGGVTDVDKAWRLTMVNDRPVRKDADDKAAVATLLTEARAASYSLTFATRQMEEEAAATREAADAAAAAAVEAAAKAEADAAAAAAVEEEKARAEAEAEAAKAAAEVAAAVAAAAAAAAAAAEEEAKRKAAEEEAARLHALQNGEVVVVYQQYDDAFKIVDGELKGEVIDEEYCLSDVMPNCQIHLSVISPEEYTYSHALKNSLRF